VDRPAGTERQGLFGVPSQLTEEQIHDVPAPGEWSIHQVIAHVRDTERYVFLERVQRILTETHPAVENFDQDAWIRPLRSNEPLKRIVADFRSLRRKLISLLRKVERQGLGELGYAF